MRTRSAYVVRDRRADRQRLLGLAVSAVVVVLVCVVADAGWVAVVGLPLAALWVLGVQREETAALTADGETLSLGGRRTPWRDVEEVRVAAGGVEVVLRADAPLPPWAGSRVHRVGDPSDRLTVAGPVPAPVDAVVAGLREVAPVSTMVRSV